MSASVWMQVLDWLKEMDARLPSRFPPELSPLTTPDFWFRAARLEMSTRDTLSSKIRSLVTDPAPPAMTLLESWLYRRRVEWAVQVVIAKVQESVQPDAPIPEILEWLLIRSWETDGCVAFWNHAEREGEPPGFSLV